MDKRHYIDLFTELGERLKSFIDSSNQSVIAEAVADNAWFTKGEIMEAVESLRQGMLRREVLEKWLLQYDMPYGKPKRVAIIMAGNIPLVGFSDLMCVIATGNSAFVKTSSKDSALMIYIIGQIKDIDNNAHIFEYSDTGQYDAVIATGSNESGKYFRSVFGGLPAIIRGSRSSVAILAGDENDVKLKLLGKDIFKYSGMGCRNVSLIFAPVNYDIAQLGLMIAPQKKDINRKYYNNYISAKAKLFASGENFTDCSTFVFTEGDSFPASLSNIVVFSYRDISEVYEWLKYNDNSIQCVVGDEAKHPRSTGFGQAQIPFPWDYPDGEDVVRFLNAIQI